MTKSIPERITQDVVDTLEGIRVVSGYRFDAVVEHVSASVNKPSGNGFLVVGDSDPTDLESDIALLTDWEMNYTVGYMRVRSENDTNRSASAIRSETFGEIVRALMVDQKRGGLALRTHSFSHENDSDGSGKVAGAVTFTVQFRTLMDNIFASAFEA